MAAEPRPSLEELRRLAEAAAPLWERGRKIAYGPELNRLVRAREEFRSATTPATILHLIDLLQEKGGSE